MGAGHLVSVTIAKDSNDTPLVLVPWLISIKCFSDAAYTQACTDWVAPTAANGNQTNVVVEHATSTVDNKYWTAYFTDPTRDANYGGTPGVRFIASDYYQLVIDDTGWDIPVFGSQALHEAYWVMTGSTL